MNLETFDYINIEDKKFCDIFFSSSNPRYILGRNKWAISLLKNITVDGVVDDFYEGKERFYEQEIFKSEVIPKNSYVINASMGGVQTAKKRLDNLGLRNIDYFAFYKYSGLDITPPPFITDFKEDFISNNNRYHNIYNKLMDKKSKRIFEEIINFKITLDLKFMENFTNNTNLQYFEDELFSLPNDCVFIDGGGYTGDTTMNFIEKYENYKKIYLFEPDKKNIILAKKNIEKYENIEIIEAGLSRISGEAYFNEDEASSSISLTGTQKIKVDAIDNLIEQKVDFIKLDIEGAEQDAIEGAKDTIKKYHPILAICIYHKAQDWYKIPEKIMEYYNKYELYVRHYMEGISETVMYFVPPNRIVRGSKQ